MTAPDLIRFLIAKGGVQDQGGELRGMDLPARARFGNVRENADGN